MLDRQGTLEDAIARAATGRVKRAATVVAEGGGEGKEHEPCDPNEDGTCPDGYELDDEDGLCHWTVKASAAAVATVDPAIAEAEARKALDAQQAAEAAATAEAQQHDRDWLDVI
jgi:hypothetical protein